MSYANFWKRTAAAIIDAGIFWAAWSFIGNIVGLVAAIAMGVSFEQGETPLTAMLSFFAVCLLIQIVCMLLYYVWPESSPWQATVGKKMLGLKVTDLNGQRISFMRSLGRNLGMFLSTLLLCVGYLMCFWTEKRQCLHDSLSNCLVLDTKPQEKQGCIVGAIIGSFVLICLLFFLLIGGIITAIALPQYEKTKEMASVQKTISLLADTQTAQRMYQQEHAAYATHWNQLTANPCPQQDSAFCDIPGFTLELEEQGVAAQRTSGAFSYRLFRAYDSEDIKRDLVCISTDERGKSFCHTVMEQKGPSSR